jgi:hypothetical protein
MNTTQMTNTAMDDDDDDLSDIISISGGLYWGVKSRK